MVTKIIRTVVIIIMCLFHDFSELDLTKVSMIKVVTKVKSKVVTKVVTNVVTKDWDFSTLAHLLLYNSVGVDGTLVGTDSQLEYPPRMSRWTQSAKRGSH